MNSNSDATVVVDRVPVERSALAVARLRLATPASDRWVGPAVFVYGALTAFLVAFVLYPSQHLVASTIDLNGFGALARSVAQGHGFSFGFGPTMRRAPLYPFLGAGFLKAFGSGSLGQPDSVAYRPILAANCLIFGLTCLTVWATGRRLFGPRVALFTALVCPFIPQSIRYVGMTEVETITGLFTALLVLTGLNLVERPGLLTGIWFGLAAAAATLTKPVTEFYPFLFLILAWCCWYTQRHASVRTVTTRTRLTATAAVLACFGLALIPWTVRNLTVTNGQFLGISSDGPGSILRGHINTQSKYYLLRPGFDYNGAWEIEANAYEESVLHQYGLPFYRYLTDSRGRSVVSPAIPRGETSAITEARQEHAETTAVKRFLLRHPLAFLKQLIVQVATFWYLETTRFNSLVVGGVALIVLVLAVLGILRGRREHVTTWPIVAVVLYTNLAYAASLALGRYSAPLFPTLLVLAGGGLASLATTFYRRPQPLQHADPFLTALREK